jgi:plastocyanin domain-containing protein
MKKNGFYLIGVILIVIVGAAFLFFNSGNALSSGNVESQEVQVVKLSVQSGNYVLEPSELKQGIRVRLEADMTRMPGCSKSIVIPAFGVSKTFTTTDNAVEFVPDKAGTFNIACSMNMYRGTFTVLDETGKKSDYVEQKLSTASTGSCGDSGGGCGCGGLR